MQLNQETVPPRRWATIVVIGLIGGLLSGLFAIGGGIIMACSDW